MKMQSAVLIPGKKDGEVSFFLMKGYAVPESVRSWTRHYNCDIISAALIPGRTMEEACEVSAQIGLVSFLPAAGFILRAGPDDHGVLFFDERHKHLYHYQGRYGEAGAGGDDGRRRKPERLFFPWLSGTRRSADRSAQRPV